MSRRELLLELLIGAIVYGAALWALTRDGLLSAQLGAGIGMYRLRFFNPSQADR
jgi:hypothetical protein